MKKTITVMFVTTMIIILGTFCFNKVYAATKSTEKPITNETESKLVELKEKEMKSLED